MSEQPDQSPSSTYTSTWYEEERVTSATPPERVVDLRSDTVTKPTPEMRRAMAEAEVGDDVFGEDPTVARLERMAAERLGKEAGLFVTSGTQGNQVSLMAHTQRGDEIILDENCHIFNYEVASLAVLSAVQPRTLRGPNGILDPEGHVLVRSLYCRWGFSTLNKTIFIPNLLEESGLACSTSAVGGKYDPDLLSLGL